MDDGTGADEVANDGVYTLERLYTVPSADFFEENTLPYDVGVRVVVKDVDGNYCYADTVLTVVAP